MTHPNSRPGEWPAFERRRRGLRALIERRVPAILALRDYDLGAARADLIAGLSVAAVALPQAMAYALIVGLPPETGLYTAIVMTAVGALFDSSRQLINGPTNAISIALLSAVGALASPADRVQMAILMAFLVGGVQLTIAFLRLGDLTRYISHSVIVGFTSGASVLLILDQMKNFLGLASPASPHDHFLYRFWMSMAHGGAPNVPTMMVGVGTIALIVSLRWIKGKLGWALLPELLISVVVAAWVTARFGLEAKGVKVIGHIPASLPRFALPVFHFEHMRSMASSALALGLLGLLEAISMAKAIAAVTRQRLDLNQQCLSEAVANLAGSFFQCMPGSGSLTRSAVNQQAGGRTQWAGVVAAAAVALTMVFFARDAQVIPRSALAAILLVTAFRMVNFKDLRYHVRVSRFDTVIVLATAFSAVAISVEFCVLVGVFLSAILAIPRTGQMLLTEFVVTPEGRIHERLDEDIVCGHLLIFGLEGEMFFGSVVSLGTHFDAIESRIGPATSVVLLRLKRARNPDASGLALFEDFIARLKNRGVHLILCGVRPALNESLVRSGLAAKLSKEQIFLEHPVRQTSTLLAVRHATELLEKPCPHCPPRNSEAFYYPP